MSECNNGSSILGQNNGLVLFEKVLLNADVKAKINSDFIRILKKLDSNDAVYLTPVGTHYTVNILFENCKSAQTGKSNLRVSTNC